MREDRLLEDLARRARERAGEGEERPRAGGETREGARAAEDLLRPLGADFEAEVVNKIRGLVGPRPALEPALPGVPASKRPPRWRGWWFPLAAAATAAAAAVVLLWLRSPQGEAALPRFELTTLGVVDERSGAGTGPATFVRGFEFRVRLVPETRVSGPVGARFFVTRDDRWLPWESDVLPEPTGALDCRMDRELSLEPGTWTLVAAVGRPRSLPSGEEAQALFEAGSGGPRAGPWRLETASFRVESGEDG